MGTNPQNTASTTLQSPSALNSLGLRKSEIPESGGSIPQASKEEQSLHHRGSSGSFSVDEGDEDESGSKANHAAFPDNLRHVPYAVSCALFSFSPILALMRSAEAEISHVADRPRRHFVWTCSHRTPDSYGAEGSEQAAESHLEPIASSSPGCQLRVPPVRR